MASSSHTPGQAPAGVNHQRGSMPLPSYQPTNTSSYLLGPFNTSSSYLIQPQQPSPSGTLIWTKLNAIYLTIIATITVVITFVAYLATWRLSVWTARKDFAEWCLEIIQANVTLSASCEEALGAGISAPPVLHRVKRGLDVLEDLFTNRRHYYTKTDFYTPSAPSRELTHGLLTGPRAFLSDVDDIPKPAAWPFLIFATVFVMLGTVAIRLRGRRKRVRVPAIILLRTGRLALAFDSEVLHIPGVQFTRYTWQESVSRLWWRWQWKGRKNIGEADQGTGNLPPETDFDIQFDDEDRGEGFLSSSDRDDHDLYTMFEMRDSFGTFSTVSDDGKLQTKSSGRTNGYDIVDNELHSVGACFVGKPQDGPGAEGDFFGGLRKRAKAPKASDSDSESELVEKDKTDPSENLVEK